MDDWEDSVVKILNQLGQNSPEVEIESLVNIAVKKSDAGDAYLKSNPQFRKYAPQLRAIYQKSIVSMEQRATRLICSKPNIGEITQRIDADALSAYRRIDDIFEHIDFTTARLFVMVGCGYFPVTALQATQRFKNLKVVALDTDPQALIGGRQVTQSLGLTNIEFNLHDGATYDYTGADIIFVANMVSPKDATIRRILDTSRHDTSIVVREPYGLGCLWTERAEDSLDSRVCIKHFGVGSRYLSRNAFLRRHSA
jgi:SAM-dependent methyltransferase